MLAPICIRREGRFGILWVCYRNICQYNSISPPAWNNDSKKQSLKAYIRNDWTVCWNILANRRLFDSLRFPKGISFCEDFYVAVRLVCLAPKVVTIKEPLYHYVQLNPDSLIHQKGSKRMYDELRMYTSTIDWLKGQDLLRYCEREMSWRVLNAKQDLALDEHTHSDFLQIYPESKQYIFSCPALNLKMKVIIWLLTHHLRFLVIGIIRIRRWLGR